MEQLKQVGSHLRTTGSALKNWLIAQTYDAIAVGAMWLVGLWIIGVPWAPLWAFLGAAFQFIPNFGLVLSLVGPELAALFTGDLYKNAFILLLYAIIAVTDGLFLQPYIMKRTVKIPIWASITVPIVFGIVLPFWGVLLAPPVLAIIYTFRAKNRATKAVVQSSDRAISR